MGGGGDFFFFFFLHTMFNDWHVQRLILWLFSRRGGGSPPGGDGSGSPVHLPWGPQRSHQQALAEDTRTRVHSASVVFWVSHLQTHIGHQQLRLSRYSSVLFWFRHIPPAPSNLVTFGVPRIQCVQVWWLTSLNSLPGLTCWAPSTPCPETLYTGITQSE